MNRPLQFIVLLIGGLIYGFFTIQSIMWAIWGAPTHPVQYIALFSALGLLLSAFVALAFPATGRWMSILCSLGIGIYYIPSSQSLVPSATLIISPIAYLLIGGYFAFLAFCLFYPKRFPFSVPVFALSILIAFGFSVHTLFDRISGGEFRRPELVYFNWTPSDVDIHIAGTRDQKWLSEDMISSLSTKGIRGLLHWQGSQGNDKNRPKMIIISSAPIRENKDLHYPKGEYVIYIFNGTHWITISDSNEFYPSFATLQTDGMIRQKLSGGGIEEGLAFHWK